MSRLIQAFCLFIFMSLASWSQVPDDFPSVTLADLPGAVISLPRVFNGSSLFGYINGGAELYLEYGFSLASITEISLEGGKYKTEIYKMNGPEEAFGIFSVSKFRCLDMPGHSDYTCRTRYQLQICKGPYYISIINSGGSAADSAASARIGSLIAQKIPEGELNLSQYLPGIPTEIMKTSCFLAKGRLGIVNGDPELEDFFRGTGNFTAVVLKGEEDYTISVKFSDPDSMKNFMESNGIEISGTRSPGSNEMLSARYLSENHLIISKRR